MELTRQVKEAQARLCELDRSSDQADGDTVLVKIETPEDISNGRVMSDADWRGLVEDKMSELASIQREKSAVEAQLGRLKESLLSSNAEMLVLQERAMATECHAETVSLLEHERHVQQESNKQMRTEIDQMIIDNHELRQAKLQLEEQLIDARSAPYLEQAAQSGGAGAKEELQRTCAQLKAAQLKVKDMEGTVVILEAKSKELSSLLLAAQQENVQLKCDLDTANEAASMTPEEYTQVIIERDSYRTKYTELKQQIKQKLGDDAPEQIHTSVMPTSVSPDRSITPLQNKADSPCSVTKTPNSPTQPLSPFQARMLKKLGRKDPGPPG